MRHARFMIGECRSGRFITGPGWAEPDATKAGCAETIEYCARRSNGARTMVVGACRGSKMHDLFEPNPETRELLSRYTTDETCAAAWTSSICAGSRKRVAYRWYTPDVTNSSNSAASMWRSRLIDAMILIACDNVLPVLYGRSRAVNASKISAIASIRAGTLSSSPDSRFG